MTDTLNALAPILSAELRRRMKRDAPQIPSDIFDLHIVPDERPGFYAKGGAIVNIYVSGLNVVGGPTKLEDKQFWKDLVTFTRKGVKALYQPHALLARGDLVTIRDFRLKSLKYKRDIAERIPGLLDKKEIRIVKEKCTTTWKAFGTLATVTLTYDLDDATQAFEEARTKLSQKVREEELENIDKEIEEMKKLIGGQDDLEQKA